ncbi:hypothetical protein GCM10008101_00130 [Lysobacter xinjiangensis]|uniref:Uncharacterized protein n=1 Tax=Cognatilysobacter xinjiangensis TaxID=546892 RepID=A0ABQ3BLS8_9GAMM|nr:hypothetical protein [Lysobacter xinjiangensis]GGZ51144.1 hypothetical protein GCM10008101_00130 [Lysobacter xinjiangensis]
MAPDVNRILVLAAALSALAALLHVAVIAGGPDWYRFFGAGERMARLAEARSVVPAVVTLGIALILAAWSVYAASAAGLLRPLPLTAAALVAITAVYVLRGLALVPVALMPALRTSFNLWSSAICLAIGLVHAVGLWQVWKRL